MVRIYRLHGPPGTGKTFTLASTWIPRAAAKYGSDRVMCCSLTRAAATELAARADLPRAQVGTLHSFAHRALGRPVIAESKIAEWNLVAGTFVMDEGSGPNPDDPYEGRGVSADDYLAALNVLRQKRLPPTDALRPFSDRWRAWLGATAYTDFTGLLERCLDEHVPCPVGHAMIFVDEAQDCSVLELDLVHQWAKDAEGLVLVGDSMQAIYEWRGADARAFLAADVAPEDERELRQSYRLPAAVLAQSVAIARNISVGHLVDFAPRVDEAGAPASGEVVRSSANTRDAASLIREINLALAAVPGRVMVLASCGYMLHGILALLREAGAPFDHPWRRQRGDWNPLHGAARRLLAWLAVAERDWTWGELSSWVDHMQADTFLVRGGKGEIGGRSDAEETRDKRADPHEIQRFFQPGELAKCLLAAEEGNVEWLKEHMLASQCKAWHYPLMVHRKHGKDGLAVEPRLTVGTIHSVKGAEADCVIVLPDLSGKGAEEWHTSQAGRDAIGRMFYVAVTRARQRLVLCQSGGRSFYPWPQAIIAVGAVE